MAKLNHYIGVFPDHEAASLHLERHGSKEVGLLYRNVDGTIYMCDGEGWLPLATGESAVGSGGLDGLLFSVASKMGDIIAERVSEAVGVTLKSIVIQAPAAGDPYLPHLDESVVDVNTESHEMSMADGSTDLAAEDSVDDAEAAGDIAALRKLKKGSTNE